MKCHLYVSLFREDKILIFAADSQTGKLQAQGEMQVSGSPANMAFDPGQQFIYVGRKADRSISSYRRNSETGAISLAGTVPVGLEPDYLATDRKGRFLFSTYISEGRLAVHQIGRDGILQTLAVEWLTTYRGIHSIQMDPSNRFAFIPHIAGNDPNIILQFKFNEATVICLLIHRTGLFRRKMPVRAFSVFTPTWIWFISAIRKGAASPPINWMPQPVLCAPSSLFRHCRTVTGRKANVLIFKFRRRASFSMSITGDITASPVFPPILKTDA